MVFNRDKVITVIDSSKMIVFILDLDLFQLCIYLILWIPVEGTLTLLSSLAQKSTSNDGIKMLCFHRFCSDIYYKPIKSFETKDSYHTSISTCVFFTSSKCGYMLG